MKKIYEMDGDFILGKEKIKVKEYILDIDSNYTYYRGEKKLKRNCKYGYKLVNELGEKIADLTRKKYLGKDGIWYTAFFSFIKNGKEFLLRLNGWGFEDGKTPNGLATLTSKSLKAA